MYKQIRDITVAFIVWFVLAYICTALMASVIELENYFNIYKWSEHERGLLLGNIFCIGWLVFKQIKSKEGK